MHSVDLRKFDPKFTRVHAMGSTKLHVGYPSKTFLHLLVMPSTRDARPVGLRSELCNNNRFRSAAIQSGGWGLSCLVRELESRGLRGLAWSFGRSDLIEAMRGIV